MTRYKNKYRVESTRLKGWDYTAHGHYFITICTHNKQPFFGEIVGGEIQINTFLARFTAAKKLTQKLRKLGGKRIVPPETFHVVEREGPLYDGEIERAKEWAASLVSGDE